MSIPSKKGGLYTLMALSIPVLLSSYHYLTKRNVPSNNIFFPEKNFVHKFPHNHKNTTTKMHGFVSVADKDTKTKAHGYVSVPQKTVWSLLDAKATASLPLPQIGSYQCRDQICSEFLSTKDRESLRYCMKASQKTNIVPKCHFMNGTHRAPVALVSFPGSGNTWVRGLLEKTTGICTGSVFCDNKIRNSGAIGEHVTSGSVLVVKTHTRSLRFGNYTVAQHSEEYGAAILLVRNPLQAIVAEWNRRFYARVKPKMRTGHNRHVGSISEKYFGNYAQWQTFVSTSVLWWKTQVLSTLAKSNAHPVLVVCYEDLLENSTTEVKRMLDFLQVPYTNSNLKQRLAEDYTTFHRKHKYNYEYFTESQKQLVRTGINNVLHQLKQWKKTIPGLKKYLSSTALSVT